MLLDHFNFGVLYKGNICYFQWSTFKRFCVELKWRKFEEDHKQKSSINVNK